MFKMLKQGSIVVLVALMVTRLTGCGAGQENGGPQLIEIEVTPTDSSMAIDTIQQFTATGIYSDNSTKDLTSTVEWSSSDPDVAILAGSGELSGVIQSGSIDTAGNVYGKDEGTATITATSENKTGWGRVRVKRVKLVSIAVTPPDPVIAKGTDQRFSATGTFSDNTIQDLTASVSWNSSNTAVATISSGGLATSVGAGSTTIMATSGSISGSTDLAVNQATLVSLAVTPSYASIADGTTHQFSAAGTFSDGSTQDMTAEVTWSSSNTAIATVSNATGSKGLASSVAAGSATITASSGDVSGSALLTVNPATLVSLAVTPANPGIAKGTRQQFTATGTFSDSTTQDLTATVTWSSSNSGVATISNAAGSKGLASSVAAGSTTITAASGSISGSTMLTVNPATLVSLAVKPVNPFIAKGASQQFTATGTFSDSTTQDLTASVTWSSSNTVVATISNAAGSKGLAKSAAAGSTAVTAVSGSISANTTLTVQDRSATLSWTAPTTNENGTSLTDLAGYKIYYGASTGVYTAVINAGTATSYVVNNLSPGTYYFAVTAVNSAGSESGYSNEASKTIY